MQVKRWLGLLLAGALGLGLVILVLWAVVVVPPLLIDVHNIQDPAQRLEEVNGLRITLAGVLGGVAVLAGAIVGALNFRETSRQNRAALDLQRRGQVTERFTRAIEQLGEAGPVKLDVRIGAVYALEQIARDSADLHWPIMEVLTAFLREHAQLLPPPRAIVGKEPDPPQKRTPADHQAIATVLGRRRQSQDPDDERLDLHRVDLEFVRWEKAQLQRALLYDAQLNGAFLHKARLERAALYGALLEGVRLDGAHLEGAMLAGAQLKGALLMGAKLEGANLAMAQLKDADLTGAQLKGALLDGAHLGGVNLEGAHLERASLIGAQLEGANLEEAHLEGANLEDAHLERASLRGAQLNGANLERAHLDGADLEDVDLTWVASLTWPHLQKAKNVDLRRLPGYIRAAGAGRSRPGGGPKEI